MTETIYLDLKKRKPTFDYILNDLAFESLKLKVIHGIASNQDKFDFDYQLKLKDKEIERSNNIIKSLFDYCKEQQEKSFDSVAEECYAEVMYFISERLEKTKELKESEK